MTHPAHTRRPARARRPARDDGFVIVPVVVLLVVALGLGFALLALVDTQTAQSREERTSNAAQTLAEGVVAAAGNVMATDTSATAWPTTGPCRTYTHRLSETGGTTDLESKIVKEVNDRFAGTSADLDDAASRRTTWTLNLCPVAGAKATPTAATWTQDDAVWNPSNLPTATYLQTTITAQPSGIAPAAVSVWARAQANVQSPTTAGTTTAVRSRAVVAKLRQSSSTFRPPPDFAVSTGALSTDLTTSLSTTLFNDSALVGGLTGKLLGTKALIGGGKIGTRCSLLGGLSLNDLGSTCVSGTVSGASALTSALSLGSLNTLLGINNQATLSAWAMAPPEVLQAYAAAAQRRGTYVVGGASAPSSDPWRITGYGQNDANPATASPLPSTASAGDCIPAAQLAAATTDSVFYIKQVGNGDQYCTLNSGTAGIVIVERGSIRVTGAFRGVIYAANLQECGSDGLCDANERRDGAKHPREVVRIDSGGTVTGSVWADGAGGRIGIIPPKQTTKTLSTNDILVSSADPNSPCGAPVGLGGAVNDLATSLGSFLGGTLNFVLGSYYVLPDSTTQTVKPTGCQLLKLALVQVGKNNPDLLAKLLIDGGTVDVTVGKHSCLVLGLACSDSSTTTRVTVPAGTTISNSSGSGPESALSAILGLLTSTVTTPNYQAITYDAAAAGLSPAPATGSSVVLPQGAAPVVGSYLNVPADSAL